MNERQPVEALLIDPNPEDVSRFLGALENEKIANEIHTVSSGGEDLLEEFDDVPELAGTPVIVLTESDEAESIAKSYDLHANAYVQKPVDPDEFVEAVRSIENFWLEIVWLPPGEAEDDEARR